MRINCELSFKALRSLTLAIATFCVLIQCSEDLQISPEVAREIENSHQFPETISTEVSACEDCTFVVPADSAVIDGKVLFLPPGSTICLSNMIQYGTLEFRNIVGTEERPIVIKNCGGTANIRATSKWYALKTSKCKYFRITGGSLPGAYGINIQGGIMGMTMEFLSSNFEVDHVEVSNVEFAGIMAKTDPSCNDSTIRGNFTMYNVSLHHNYVHETGGEGFYVGNSFYDGMQRPCGTRLPHEIKGLKIFDNTIKNSGWEAIQVGCAREGTEIYNNSIENYGVANKLYQNNGIQIGSGTGGLLYNNFIKKGFGNGMIIMGTGDNVIYNNIIVDAGDHGIFCDERFTPGEGFKFINNTILNPRLDGIRLYAEKVPMNTIVNNIISNPGTYGTYPAPRGTQDAFVYLETSAVKVDMSNNLFVTAVETVKFLDPLVDNYRLTLGSPAVNLGKDISPHKIAHDFYQSSRLNGDAYDIGASEY